MFECVRNKWACACVRTVSASEFFFFSVVSCSSDLVPFSFYFFSFFDCRCLYYAFIPITVHFMIMSFTKCTKILKWIRNFHVEIHSSSVSRFFLSFFSSNFTPTFSMLCFYGYQRKTRCFNAVVVVDYSSGLSVGCGMCVCEASDEVKRHGGIRKEIRECNIIDMETSLQIMSIKCW